MTNNNFWLGFTKASLNSTSSIASYYRYYHKLYLLTRERLPRRLVKMIGRSRIVRRFPSLIDPLLSKELPAFFLLETNDPYASEVLSTTIGQAVIPGGTLDRGAPAEVRAQA